MNLLFTILILLSFNVISFSQYNFGIKLNGGISRISNSFFNGRYDNRGIPKPNWIVRVAPSGQAGIYYNLQLGRKSGLGTELLFVQIEGKEKIKMMFTDRNGNSTVQGIDNNYKNISYLSLPLYFGWGFNKLSVNFGVQASYVLGSSGKSKGEFSDGLKYDNKYDELNIDTYDYGTRLGFDYSLSSKFSINGNYYHGFNNILKSSWADWKWKVRQLTVGVRYSMKSSDLKIEGTK